MVNPNSKAANKAATPNTAPSKGATPTTAPVVRASVALYNGPGANGLCNGKAKALATATTAGHTYHVPANGGQGVCHFVAQHSAPTTAASPQTWPGQYSGGTNATTATVAGGPTGTNGVAYMAWAVHVPTTGPATWAVVHVYPGKAGRSVAARAAGNGTMVACQGGTGARLGALPTPATVALAATHGLVGPPAGLH